MKCRFLLTVGVILWSTWSGFAIEKTTVNLDNLVKTFEQNPANPQTTMQLLKELSKQGKSGQDILNRYFKTQSEADYFKDYNWMIVRDYVNDINAPQLKYVFENQDKFIQHFSKDDVFQKLDNVLVNHLEQLYLQNKADYENQMKRIKETGYEHYDVVLECFPPESDPIMGRKNCRIEVRLRRDLQLCQNLQKMRVQRHCKKICQYRQ